MDKGDEIVKAINIVLNNREINSREKLELIEMYIEVYITNNTLSIWDMI